MSDFVVSPPFADSASRSRRGQSLVEFALVLPLLLVLLLGVADFGRVFTAGITIEAASRDAAEVVAQEYLRNPPGPMGYPAPPGNDPYYEALHDLAARTVCREARVLPGVTYTEDVLGTSGVDEESCGNMPIIRTCVHDGADTRCGDVAFGASVPSTCPGLSESMVSTMDGGTEDSRYVEVRVCYQFTTLINMEELQLPLGWGISVGEIWLEKDRVFGVGYYPPPPTPEPPPPPPPPPPTEAPSEEPTPTPTSTAEPSPTATETPAPTGEPTPDPTPEPTLEPTPAPTPTPEPTLDPTPPPDPTP